MRKAILPRTLFVLVLAPALLLPISGLSGRALANDNADVKTVIDNIKKLSPQDYAQSLDAYSERISKNPNDVAARFGRGYILFFQNRYQQALPDSNRAISLAPGSADVFNLHGHICLYLPNYQGAISDFDRAIELNSNDADAYCGRGSAQRHLANYQAAVADFSKALELDPRLAIAYAGRGNAYRGLKKYDQAIQDYDASLKLSRDPGVEQIRAETYEEQRDTSARKLGSNSLSSSKDELTTEDYAKAAASQYYARLQRESLLKFAEDFDTAMPQSQEKAYIYAVLSQRLHKESAENILTTIAQLNPIEHPSNGFYWCLYGEAMNRGLKPLVKVETSQLALFIKYIPEQNQYRFVFSQEIVRRAPTLSTREIETLLQTLPPLELDLRGHLMQELHSRSKTRSQ